MESVGEIAEKHQQDLKAKALKRWGLIWVCWGSALREIGLGRCRMGSTKLSSKDSGCRLSIPRQGR
jgi:hypothetical protein